MPILTTKLYRPPVTADLEPRTGLLERLDRNRQRPLTLISAPAGYGKSTLASMWLEASNCAVAWVSLDEGDNDLHTFAGYLLAGLGRAFPEVKFRTPDLLKTPGPLLSDVLARYLMSDLEQIEEPFILALDDLYMIHEQAVFDLLNQLLRHPMPMMHLLLITRRDPPLPIATLRAYRQITEIRTRDLRFSSADTAGFLTKMLGREIDDATATAWTERTEGWVTALCLAAISLRHSDDHETNLDDVPPLSHYLQEYLLAEVMDHLDATLKEWLLTIAWLDRFCPALCAAVSLSDSAAAEAAPTSKEFIQQLQRYNLFVIPLDSENRWFRLHHLFRSLLRTWGRNHYHDDEIAAFHHRAGAWFAHQEFPDEAIRYLVLAGDIAGAEQVVLRHRYALMNSGRWHTLERWLGYFPESALDRSSLLTSTVASLALRGRNYQTMRLALQKAEQLLANLAPNSAMKDPLLGELSVIKSSLAIAAGNVEAVTTNARRGLQLLPADALDLRAVAWGALAAGMQMSGQYASGYQLLREKISEPEWGEAIQAKLMCYLCMIGVLQGDLTVALEWADRVRSIGERLDLPESLYQARYFTGAIHFVRGESDAAEPHLSALVENEATSSPTVLAMGAMALALIRNERGDVEHADAILDRLTTHFRQGGDSAALALLNAFRVELALRRGNRDAARRQQVGVEFDGRPPIWFFYIPQFTPVKLLLAEGTPEALAVAHATLDDFEQRMRLVNRNLVRIEALALLALVCEAQGDAARADASLSTALALAQGAGLIRPFVDLGPPMAGLLVRLQRQRRTSPTPDSSYVARILAAFPPPDPAGPQVEPMPDDAKPWPVPQPMLEPLTQRESQILELLATELSPDEIGRRLSISTSTVRTHSRNIYAKLDVHTRFEAVHRVSELGLRWSGR